MSKEEKKTKSTEVEKTQNKKYTKKSTQRAPST